MISETDIFIRVGFAFLSGMIIGFDRESHGRAAGLRTMILVCVAAALGMIFSEELGASGVAPGGTWRPDPGRLAAGLLTGIGFLGAGTIVRQEHVVRGVTTAAMLWFATILGMIFGGGEIVLGLIGLGVALFILVGISAFERYVKSDWFGHISITTELDEPTEAGVKQQLQRMAVTVLDLDLDYDLQQKQRTMVFEIRVRPADAFRISEEAVRHFSREPGVQKVKWT
jgi:putative Mg2+ transporter-C (MgtC) family protein